MSSGDVGHFVWPSGEPLNMQPHPCTVSSWRLHLVLETLLNNIQSYDCFHLVAKICSARRQEGDAEPQIKDREGSENSD